MENLFKKHFVLFERQEVLENSEDSSEAEKESIES